MASRMPDAIGNEILGARLEDGEAVLWTGAPAEARVKDVLRQTLLRGLANVVGVVVVCVVPLVIGVIPVQFGAYYVLLVIGIIAVMIAMLVQDVRRLRSFGKSRYAITDRRLIHTSVDGPLHNTVVYRKGIFAQVTRRTWKSLGYFYIAIQSAGGEKVELSTLDAIEDADEVEKLLRRVLL